MTHITRAGLPRQPPVAQSAFTGEPSPAPSPGITMIHVHAFASPNSLKVPIALEEMGIAYELHAVNIRQGAQKSPSFTALNANAKVPVLIDEDAVDGPLVLSESAAILVYLAEAYGQLLPVAGIARARTFEQLFFHASALSPAYGQSGYFEKLAPERLPAAIERFHNEAIRTTAVLNGLLAVRPYVAGDTYTIADIAHFGWMWRRAFAGIELASVPNVERWYNELAQRPAVVRAIARVDALVPQP